MPFNPTGILLLHSTPKTSFHFCHPTFMQWPISSSISPLCWMIEPRYLNFATFRIVIPSMVTSPLASSLPLKQHCRYLVFDLLTLKGLRSSVCVHRSNLSLTPSLERPIIIYSTYTKIMYYFLIIVPLLTYIFTTFYISLHVLQTLFFPIIC